MAYPVGTLTRPSVLTGQTNGKLSSSILEATPGLAGGVTVTLVAPAARAWRALTAAALAAGHTLKATSVADSYRKYEIQERIFRDRYTLNYLAGRPSKIWNGRRWYQRPGTAVAAVPGTSNHGWGLAVDTGEERDSDAAAESLDSDTLNWLIENEGRYGFSHEVQSEPWHIRYNSGDNIPKAVLEFERGAPSEEDDEVKQNIMWFEDPAGQPDKQHAYHVVNNHAKYLDTPGLNWCRWFRVVEIAGPVPLAGQQATIIHDGPCKNV